MVVRNSDAGKGRITGKLDLFFQRIFKDNRSSKEEGCILWFRHACGRRNLMSFPEVAKRGMRCHEMQVPADPGTVLALSLILLLSDYKAL